VHPIEAKSNLGDLGDQSRYAAFDRAQSNTLFALFFLRFLNF